jgi:2,3-bisphosphoglycerate-independent phosphoglycerate mutase
VAKKPLLLMILDGWGIAPPSPYNAVTQAKTPNLQGCFQNYPHTQLLCSGENVGLPAGQMGNSEVGHLNIGAGRIIYQDLTRITKAIKDGDFFKNQVLLEAMTNAKTAGHALHLMGLLSDGGVHSHIQHLFALLKMAKENGVQQVYVHAFLDGRDVGPQSAGPYIEELEAEMHKLGLGRLVTVSGRYYAMDRDKRWPRVEKAYRALVLGEGAHFASALEGLKASYAEKVNDEFVVPFVIDGKDNALVKAGDSIIFYNFRPDRARELTRALNDKEFTFFDRPANARPVHMVCMTSYDVTIDAPVAFPPEHYDDTLGSVLAKHGLHQLRIAETEKYAHVTFFFNGGEEAPNPLEERLLIPSPKVATYDLQPEMSAYKVTEALLGELDKDKFDVIILNFANPDMVGHTGILSAAVKAIEAVDTCVGKIVPKVLSLGGTVCITADHGNSEKLREEDGTPCTSHTTNPVPFIVVSNEKHAVHAGRLADIAPTMLELLHIEKPKAMTGSSLLDK